LRVDVAAGLDVQPDLAAQGVARVATRRGSSVCPDQVAITKARRRALLIPLLPQRDSRTSQSRGSFASLRSHGRRRSEHHPIGHREAATPSHARSLDRGVSLPIHPSMFRKPGRAVGQSAEFSGAPVSMRVPIRERWRAPRFQFVHGPASDRRALPSGRKLGVCRSYSSVEHFCGERSTFGPPNVLGAFKNTWKPALNTSKARRVPVSSVSRSAADATASIRYRPNCQQHDGRAELKILGIVTETH